MLKVRLRF